MNWKKQTGLWLLWQVIPWLVPPASLAQEPSQIKLATQAPRGGSIHTALLKVSDALRKGSCGGTNLIVYTDGAMGGEADIVRRMRVGQVQAAVLSIPGLQQIDSSVTALQLMPMMFRDLDEVSYVREKLSPRIAQNFANKGYVVLGWADAGWVRYFSRDPVIHPGDLKPMKQFVWAGDPKQAGLMKSMGYQTVVLEVNDTLNGLETRQIDVVATIPYHALSAQLTRTARHMLEVNWVPLAGALVITRKAWDELCPEQRQLLARAGRQATDEIAQSARQEAVAAVKAMEKRGLIVHRMTPETEDEWRKAAEAIYPSIRGNLVPADMFDEVQRLLRERRAAERK